MKRRTLLTTGGAAMALAGTGSLSFAQDAAIEIPDMVLGSADAPIEMIEYASYTCPHCARFHANVYPQLKADYIETGKVRFVYREVYFDRFGLWASMIARCAGPERFFGITDLMYERQGAWLASRDPETIIAELRKLAKTAGMDDATLDACLEDGPKAQALVGWYQANAERDSISSTPSFLIDGQNYSNMAYPAFQQLLDGKLG